MSDEQSIRWKLWIYTNYDCNLRCSYCVAESTPTAARRPLSPQSAFRLVDEAAALGFCEVFFTGGEPFIIDEIYEMLAYASQRIQTTVLTNAILLKGRRLEKLVAINHPSLCVQVSLDGGLPQHHDAYRGAGAWQQTVDGIARLQAHGFKIRLSTTETPANKDHLDLLCEFHQSLGIPEEAHLIRPLAARGFSKEGLQVSIDNLSPEVTVNLDGAFWHPLSTAEDMRVSASPFPLSSVVASIKARLEAQTGAPLKTVT